MLLKIGYLILTLITIVFILQIGLKAINASSATPKKDKIILIFGLALWQLFILFLSSTSLLQSYEFPPRFAIAFIIPSFIFTGIFLYKNKRKKWIHEIPQQWIIYFPSFRILVETLFVFSVTEGILNYHVTIEGYNFDMIFAFTAPIIAYSVYTKKWLSKKVVLFWNYIGLGVLASVIFLFITVIYKPDMYGSNTPLLPLEAFTYPYVLIAGFLMPVAVFLHILSIIQYTRK